VMHRLQIKNGFLEGGNQPRKRLSWVINPKK